MQYAEDDKKVTPWATATYTTLGCKLNFSETASLSEQLARRGIVPAGSGDSPDLCVVNTCTVTELADRKCRQQVRALARRFPNAMVVVMGCYAQLKPDEAAALPAVALVLGSEQKPHAAEYIERALIARQHHDPDTNDSNGITAVSPLPQIRSFAPSCSRGNRTRYWLKVQDGCDYFCSYCTIPIARGRSRSGTIADLTAQARQVAREGGREIVITGVNIGDFGRHNGETLLDLLRALDNVEGIERYRISSVEPDLLTDDIITFVANSRAFMPHFHIPLQSGNDDVLQLMRRHYRRDVFANRVALCRQAMPDCFIGVDIMVGTRGETPERYADSRDFINALNVQHLHVFPYSERPGTTALRIPHVVSKEQKQQRAAEMAQISNRKQREFINRFLGTTRPALMEHLHSDSAPMLGFTDNYIRVRVDKPQPTLANRVVNVRLNSMNDDLTVNAQILTDL